MRGAAVAIPEWLSVRRFAAQCGRPPWEVERTLDEDPAAARWYRREVVLGRLQAQVAAEREEHAAAQQEAAEDARLQAQGRERLPRATGVEAQMLADACPIDWDKVRSRPPGTHWG